MMELVTTCYTSYVQEILRGAFSAHGICHIDGTSQSQECHTEHKEVKRLNLKTDVVFFQEVVVFL